MKVKIECNQKMDEGVKISKSNITNYAGNGRFTYSPFHKTLPRSSLQMHLISVRFYEMGDIKGALRKS